MAKFSDQRNFTVYYKQATEPQTDPAQLTGLKTYSVTAEATSETGIYGKLTVNIRKACQATKADAEAGTASVGNSILAKLRETNAGKTSETDRLEVRDASAAQYNPLQSYEQISPNGDKVTYFYNPCDLKTYEITKKPNIQAWEETQTLSITSGDLNALAALRDSLAAEYALEVENPNEVVVSLGWSATAILSVLEAVSSDIEKSAAEKFLARGSEYNCDVGKFSFACFSSSYDQRKEHHAGRSMNQESAAPGGEGYTDQAAADVDASERGLKPFTGRYSIEYTVRKVLKRD